MAGLHQAMFCDAAFVDLSVDMPNCWQPILRLDLPTFIAQSALDLVSSATHLAGQHVHTGPASCSSVSGYYNLTCEHMVAVTGPGDARELCRPHSNVPYVPRFRCLDLQPLRPCLDAWPSGGARLAALPCA